MNSPPRSTWIDSGKPRRRGSEVQPRPRRGSRTAAGPGDPITSSRRRSARRGRSCPAGRGSPPGGAGPRRRGRPRWRCRSSSRRRARRGSRSTPRGSVWLSTVKPWFIEVISTLPVASSFTGWLAPWWPWFILMVRAPRASASIWWPRQMPKTGIEVFSSTSLIIGTAYSPVAAGSPGPFERKRPSGSWASTSSAVAVAGSTVTSQPAEARQRRMLRLAP